MSINWNYVEKNEKLINEKLGARYPEAKVTWRHDKENEVSYPTLHLGDELCAEDVMAYAAELVVEYGGEEPNWITNLDHRETRRRKR